MAAVWPAANVEVVLDPAVDEVIAEEAVAGCELEALPEALYVPDAAALPFALSELELDVADWPEAPVDEKPEVEPVIDVEGDAALSAELVLEPDRFEFALLELLVEGELVLADWVVAEELKLELLLAEGEEAEALLEVWA